MTRDISLKSRHTDTHLYSELLNVRCRGKDINKCSVQIPALAISIINMHCKSWNRVQFISKCCTERPLVDVQATKKQKKKA